MSWVRHATAPEVELEITKAKERVDGLTKALKAMVDSGKITQQEISILNDQIWEVNNILDAAIKHLEEPQAKPEYEPSLRRAD